MVSITTANWRLDGICGVLFDKDGTLIDSHIYWGRIIERRASAIVAHFRLAEDIFGDLCRTMGFDVQKRRLLPEGPIALVTREEVISILEDFLVQKGVPESREVLATLFTQEHHAFLDELFQYVRLLPGVVEVLETLKRFQVKTAVVTTDTIRNTEETLAFLKIAHLFDAVIGKESTVEPKITGVPAIRALDVLGLVPGRVVCIGDAPVDLIMAQKSGLKAGIGMETGQITLDKLEVHSPFTAVSMHDLKITCEAQEPNRGN